MSNIGGETLIKKKFSNSWIPKYKSVAELGQLPSGLPLPRRSLCFLLSSLLREPLPVVQAAVHSELPDGFQNRAFNVILFRPVFFGQLLLEVVEAAVSREEVNAHVFQRLVLDNQPLHCIELALGSNASEVFLNYYASYFKHSLWNAIQPVLWKIWTRGPHRTPLNR